MKQKLITSLVLLAFVALTTPALAQEVNVKVRANSSGTPEKVRAEAKAEAQIRMASSTEKRVEIQQDIAKRKAEHSAKVMAATIERLENIIARIESRIEKVKAAGGNTAESERFVAEAKANLSEAKVSLEAFASVDLSADKARENFSRVRAVAAEVKIHLRAAHTSMMNAVRVLKSVNVN